MGYVDWIWCKYHAKGTGEQCRVLMIGINNFSDINVIYGYVYGDKVLRGLSNILLELVRDFGKVHRIDGVCFVCVLPECGNML